MREILGSGSIFGFKFISGDGMLAFVMAPGAFLALGYLMVLFNKIAKKELSYGIFPYHNLGDIRQ